MGRMSFESVTAGVVKAPMRELIYGPEGSGKSTFCSQAPRPIYLGERGTNRLDVARFPYANDWRETLEAIAVFEQDKRFSERYGTFVIDTADWLEPYGLDLILRDAKKRNLRDVGGGFGEGHKRVRALWRDLLNRLDRLQARTGVHILITAHAHLRKFANPEGEDFERYEMKMEDKVVAGMLRDWAECVLFIGYDTSTRLDKNKRVKGVAGGARWLNTTRSFAFEAKNRYDLPDRMPLDFTEFFTRYNAKEPDDPKAIRASIEAALPKLPDIAEKVREALAKAGDNLRELQRVRNRVQARLEEIEPPADAPDGESYKAPTGDAPPAQAPEPLDDVGLDAILGGPGEEETEDLGPTPESERPRLTPSGKAAPAPTGAL